MLTINLSGHDLTQWQKEKCAFDMEPEEVSALKEILEVSEFKSPEHLETAAQLVVSFTYHTDAVRVLLPAITPLVTRVEQILNEQGMSVVHYTPFK